MTPTDFMFLFMIRVDPTRTGGPDFCTCLAKMFVCPVPKISHVMMKWCRRASHLGRFTLWNNGRRRASHLSGRFTLWNHREATQSVFVADCYVIVNVLDLPFASPIAIYR